LKLSSKELDNPCAVGQKTSTVWEVTIQASFGMLFRTVSENQGYLAKHRSLEVRIARSWSEVHKAQDLRYKVFFEEGSARVNENTLMRRDVDAYDAHCEHLLAIDHSIDDQNPRIVGTCRLLRQTSAGQCGGFYSSNAFDINFLLKRYQRDRCLELGRCCVLSTHRKRKTIELLWRGIWNYALLHRVELLIGCASLDNSDPNRIARQLSYLHHFACAPAYLNASALSSRRIEMNQLAKKAVDRKAVFRELPALVKGYLRLGARFGDGAVADHQFNTVDVLTILPTDAVQPRYAERFMRSPLVRPLQAELSATTSSQWPLVH
jgi:putative hemolysin